MSGYGDVEALWLTRIRAISGYDGTNTSRGDFKILNSGKSNQYVVIMPGAHSRQMISLSTRLETWQTVMEVYERYKDDGTTLTALETQVNTIVDAIDQYRILGDTGGTVRKGEIVEIREVVRFPPNGPEWLIAAIVGQTDEEKSITFAE